MRGTADLRRSGAHATTSLVLVLVCGSALAACNSPDNGSSTAPPSVTSTTTPLGDSPAAAAVEAGLGKHVAGDLDGAGAEYRAALKTDPRNVLALYNLGLIAQTQGDVGEAEKQYRAALAADPDYQPAVFNLAILRKAANANAEAEQLYRRAISLRPGDAGAHLNLGLLLRETGQGLQGDAEVAVARKLNPELVDPAEG